MDSDAPDTFHALIRKWFAERFGTPTDVQKRAFAFTSSLLRESREPFAVRTHPLVSGGRGMSRCKTREGPGRETDLQVVAETWSELHAADERSPAPGLS